MDFNIKYHTFQNEFRKFWINFLEKELADKNLAGFEIINNDEPLKEPILAFDEFDIQIQLVPNAKNRSLKLSLGDEFSYLVEEKYRQENDAAVIDYEDYPIIRETVFTIRDVQKGTRLYLIIKKLRGI